MPKLRVKRHAVTQPSDPSYRLIALTQGQNALVDAADYEWLNQWNWIARWSKITRTFYVVRGSPHKKGRQKSIYMAKEIIQCDPGEQVDHRNHDTLDNRRDNLRTATSSQNSINRKFKIGSSGFRGVCWHKYKNKWHAQISVGRKKHSLGTFDSVLEAARAYDSAAKIYHGEFAVLNFSQ